MPTWMAGGNTNYAFYAFKGVSYFNDPVGIGVTSPTSKLEVAGTISTTDVKFARTGTPPTAKCATASDEGRMIMTSAGPHVCLLR